MHAVLWAYHTMPYSSTQEILYRLMYGTNVVISIELSKLSPRIIIMMEESNEDAWSVKLDLVKEEKGKARIKKEAIKQQMARKYSKKFHPQEFEERDLVLRKVELVRKP